MNTSTTTPIRVWDAPVRVFHALLAISFAGAWLTAESERLRLAHVTLGWTMVGLLVFRVVWGLLGSRYARFGAFVRGPRAVASYLQSLKDMRPEPHIGHNPAGGWMILGLLALTGITSALGLAVYNDLGGDALAEAHEAAATLMLGLVAAHLLGVLVSSLLHRENLVRAMITGRKHGQPADDNGPPRRTLALLLLTAVLGFWALQWQTAPTAAGASTASAGRHHDDRDHDDD